MKTLYLVRHAKSSWDDFYKKDFDRPLNERGKRDAPRMGKRLKERDVVPELILSSPATRALSTCIVMAGVLGYDKELIQTDQRLYHADENQLLGSIKNLKDHYNTVMLFGHNPGLTDFANMLMDIAIPNIPTCGVVACALNVGPWADTTWGKGKLLLFDYPKSKED